jgi:hypothetical protein
MQLGRLAGLCGVLAAFSLAQLAGQPYLFNQTSYTLAGLAATDDTIVQAAKGDLNADGLADFAMITASLSSNACYVQVMLGDGQGLTTGPVLSCGAITDSRVSLAIADFNGDGKLDIAVTNPQAATVMVYPGNGDGTFQAPVSTPVANASSIGVLASGDYRNNGHPDLVLVEESAYIVLLSNGDGTFQPQPAVAISLSLTAGVAADFNRGSRQDLALGGLDLASLNAYVAVLISNGDGTFQTPALYLIGGQGYSLDSLLAADVNLDGNPDLIASVYPSFYVLLGNPEGVFGNPALGGYGLATDVADFNRDGKPDVLTSNGVWLGNGTAGFHLPQPIETLYYIEELGSLAGGVGLAADVNGDGRTDLVYLQGSQVTVVLGNGDGTLAPTRTADFGRAIANSVQFAAGDFNKDGKLDVAAISSGSFSGPSCTSPPPGCGYIYVNLNNGDGSFQQTAAMPFPQPLAGLALADFNGDGKLDAVVTSQEHGTLTFLAGNGDGTLTQGASYTAGPAGDGPGQVAAADLNGDGKVDAIVANGGGQASGRPFLTVLLGNGDGTFQAPKVAKLPFDRSTVNPALATGDFNGDGHIDAAVFVEAGSSFGDQALTILLGAGDGTFSSQTSYNPSCAAVASYLDQPSITVADLRGNGISDIILYCGNRETAIFLGNGDGTFQQISCTICDPLSSPVIADFNRDGTLDMAGYTRQGGLIIAFGNGDGTFSTTVLTTGVLPGPTLAADFNGDGFPDFVFPDGILLSNPAPSFSPDSLDFGDVFVGATHKLPVTLTNLGSVPLTVSSVSVKGPGQAAFRTSDDCTSPLPAGAACTLTVTFTPPDNGPFHGALAINDSAVGASLSVSLSGDGFK